MRIMFKNTCLCLDIKYLVGLNRILTFESLQFIYFGPNFNMIFCSLDSLLVLSYS